METGYAIAECNRGARMGLKTLANKVVEYDARLARGKADEIKPEHVRKVLGKLEKKTADLKAEIASTEKEDKKARLKRKLAIAQEHVERAEWLLDKIT